MHIWAEVTSDKILFHCSDKTLVEERLIEVRRDSIGEIPRITKQEMSEMQNRRNGTCLYTIFVPEIETDFVLYYSMVVGWVEGISDKVSILERVSE